MLGVLLLVAVTLRAAFFTGFFGSDELIYSEAAYRIVTGEWPVSNYIGALRYGVNLPVAMFMKLFGVNELAANLWSFVASVAEVVLVFFIGRMLWGIRAGFLAGLTVALLPLHVHFAGRLMADSPLAFFMTLSCALFLLGEQQSARDGFRGRARRRRLVLGQESPIVYLFILPCMRSYAVDGIPIGSGWREVHSRCWR
jgi:4-amino-4-deoxy-L-arabinose transferase-like glycosyltransferase